MILILWKDFIRKKMFDLLPPEIIKEIISNLERQSLFCLSIVSSQFCGLLDNTRLLRNIVRETGYHGNLKDVCNKRLMFLYNFLGHHHRQSGQVFIMGSIDLNNPMQVEDVHFDPFGEEEEDNIQEVPLTPIASLDNIVQISGSQSCLCLSKTGEVYKLTLKDESYNFKQKLIKGLTDIVQVSAGESHSLFLTKDGHVYSLGYNEYGERGIEYKRIAGVLVSIPEKELGLIPNLHNIINVTAGKGRSFCVRNDGRVYSFGNYYHDKPLLGNRRFCYIPELIPTLENIIHVSDREELVLFLDVKGQVYAHGKISKKISYDEPRLIPGVSDVIQISSTESHVLCLRDDGQVYIFGEAYYKEVRFSRDYTIPALIPDLDNVIKISAGHYRSLFVTICGDTPERCISTPKVYVCGDHHYYPEGEEDSPFTLIPDVDNILDISSWFGYDLVIRKNITAS